MTQLPRGVQIRRFGESLERVQTQNNDIHLLGHGDGSEVWRQVIRPGGSFTIAPADGWDALEFFYVLDGRLAWEGVDSTLVLTAGDSVSAHKIKEAARFVAVTEVSILYVCSQPTFHQVSKLGRELIQMAIAVEEKDGYTASHCERIRALSLRTAGRLTLSPMRRALLGYAAFLHDVGKVRVPIEILGKPSSLSRDEWVIMKQHPTFGREMLADTFLSEAGIMVEQHHERLDGSGYPHGLRDGEILLEAQVIAVVDSFDAMTTDRPYRNAYSKAYALREIERCTGTSWSDEVGDAFLRTLKDMEASNSAN